MVHGTQADLLRSLAHQDNGLLLSQLPKALLDADLLTVASEDGLIEIGSRSTEPAWSKGELIEVERWHWRSATERGFKPLWRSLPDFLAGGTSVRLTIRGQAEASRLAIGGTPEAARGGKTKRGTKASRTRKTDVAITIIVRNPELDDAAVARQAGCHPSLLTKSKEYQNNADMARRALGRALVHQQRQSGFDSRTGEPYLTTNDPEVD